VAVEFNYSSTAVVTTLSGSIGSGDTSMNVVATTGFPAVPFKLTLAPETASEEIVKVTSVVGLALTIVRGWDGTVGLAHSSGDEVRHQATGEDLRLSRQHEDAVADVHGVGATSDVVGTLKVQTLEGKTIDSADNTLVIAQADVPNLVSDLAALVAADAAINTNIDDWDHDDPVTFSQTSLPSAYPSGFSIKKILAAGGWPVDGFVITYKLADNTRAFQWFGEGGAGSNSASYFRHYNGTAWQTHRELTNPAFGSNWLTALAATLASSWTSVLNSAINSGWTSVFAVAPASLRPSFDEDTAVQAISSTTPVAGSPVVGTTFVVPPSGQVFITVTGLIESVNNGASAALGWRIQEGGTIGSGTIVHDFLFDRALVTSEAVNTGAPGSIGASNRYLVTGLTQGSTYNVYTVHRMNISSTSGNVNYRSILAEPVL
jgi:hypothetical protein